MANSANDWSLMFYKDPRSAVGMVEKGHYILLVADGRGSAVPSDLPEPRCRFSKATAVPTPTIWTAADQQPLLTAERC